MEVAVLGTGIMGTGMARSLLRSGQSVRVWNRSLDKAEPLAADGATVAASAPEAVTGADVVLTMLYDAESVLEVLDDALGSAPEAVWLQTSTIGREGTERVARLARDRRVALLDTPVLGTKKPAEDGALVVLASGDPGLRDRVAPVLGAIGSRTVWVGEEVGQASALKLVCNAWVATLTAAVGQSVALAEALDLDPQLFLEAIRGGGIDTPYAHLKGGQMMSGSLSPSFALDGVLKDLDLISAAAREAGVPVSLLAGARRAYQDASDSGHGADDMAAVVSGFRPSS